MATFQYDSKDYVLAAGSLESNGKSKLDELVTSHWDKAMSAGVMRYDLDSVRSRVVPGKYQFFVELNTKRGVERRKPEHIETLKMPFDPTRFNFTKVKDQEIICKMKRNDPCVSSNDVAKENGIKSSESPSVVMVNVSPLGYGHILLVPQVDHGIPQRLTERGMREAIDLILLSANAGFRIGFNSLCALASVNHQHVHAWYLPRHIYTETAPAKDLHKGKVYETTDLPLNGFVLQLYGSDVADFANRAYLVTSLLQESEVAHNLFMTRGSRLDGGAGTTLRLYIWPRKKAVGVKNEVLEVFNVAVAELGGQIPSYVPERFDSLSEEEIVARIQEQRLPEEEMDALRKQVIQRLH